MTTVGAGKGPKAVVGIVLLVLGATCNAVGIELVVHPRKNDDPSAGIFWIVVSVVAMMLPGLLIVVAARRARRRAAQMDTIVALASAAQKISFSQLATDLGVTLARARELLLEAIGQRRIVGRLDLEQGAFVSGMVQGGGVQQLTMTCRGCGATSAVIVTAAAASLCPYCGFRMA